MSALGTLLALALVSFQGGLLTLWKSWNTRVHTHLQLDACVGNQAKRMRGHFDQLDRSTLAMQALRASMAADLIPAVAAGRRASLRVLGVGQRLLFASIQAERSRWTLRPCPLIEGAWLGIIPAAPYLLPVPPEDLLGSKPLETTQGARTLRLVVTSRDRISEDYGQAFVSKTHAGWKAHWIPETSPVRASAP